jgi:hypothetical protein
LNYPYSDKEESTDGTSTANPLNNRVSRSNEESTDGTSTANPLNNGVSRSNEGSTDGTSTANPLNNIGGVSKSFWNERNVIGDGTFDPVK